MALSLAHVQRSIQTLALPNEWKWVKVILELFAIDFRYSTNENHYSIAFFLQ